MTSGRFFLAWRSSLILERRVSKALEHALEEATAKVAELEAALAHKGRESEGRRQRLVREHEDRLKAEERASLHFASAERLVAERFASESGVSDLAVELAGVRGELAEHQPPSLPPVVPPRLRSLPPAGNPPTAS